MTIRTIHVYIASDDSRHDTVESAVVRELVLLLGIEESRAKTLVAERERVTELLRGLESPGLAGDAAPEAASDTPPVAPSEPEAPSRLPQGTVVGGVLFDE